MKRFFTMVTIGLGWISPSTAGDIISVDLFGGGDFSQLQGAVDFADDGDVILVEPTAGHDGYEGFQVIDKEITIMSRIGSFRVHGDVELLDVTATKKLALRGAEFDMSVHLSNCDGNVILEDFLFLQYNSPLSRLVIEDCSQTVISNAATISTPSILVPGDVQDPAVLISSSTVHITDSCILGSRGMTPDGYTCIDGVNCEGGPGGTAIEVRGASTLVMANSTTQGGLPGLGGLWLCVDFPPVICQGPPGTGGDGLVVRENSNVWISGNESHTIRCGHEDCGMDGHGDAIQVQAGSTVSVFGAVIAGTISGEGKVIEGPSIANLQMTESLYGGSVVTSTLTGAEPDAVIMALWSNTAGVSLINGVRGAPWTAIPGDFFVSEIIGSTSDAGELSFEYVVDSDPFWIGFPLHTQFVVFESGGLSLSNAASRVIGIFQDCNNNGIGDVHDIESGSSVDCNGNLVPDECSEIDHDCDSDGIPDECEIDSGNETDCDGNSVPDSCDILFGEHEDCDFDGVLDSCQIAMNPELDCNMNGVLDSCVEIEQDCNGNQLPDSCDIESGLSEDNNSDGVPDECNGVVRVPDDYPDLESAVEGALAGDMIVIADGIYRGEGNRSIKFWGKNVTVRGENGPENCIFDAEQFGSVLSYCYGEDQRSVLEGITFTNSSDNPSVLIDRTSPIVRNCIFRSNQSCAILLRVSNSLIQNCQFIENEQAPSVCINEIGIDPSFPTFRSCLFRANRGPGASAIAVNALDERINLSLLNCTFVRNSSESAGPVIYVENSITSVTNCLFWGNDPSSPVFEVMGPVLPQVSFSLIQGGIPKQAVDLGGNLSIDPEFVGNGDFHLSETSPCIDAGDPEFVPAAQEVDLDGEPRIGGNRVDIGVDEFHPSGR